MENDDARIRAYVLTEAPLFGRTRNAWSTIEPGRFLGRCRGSVAAGLRSARVGTDAGGSTRIPAAANGVVGLKQYRRGAGRLGARRFANISYVTPTTRTVMDTALMLEAMAGRHPTDPEAYGQHVGAGYVEAARQEAGLKLMRSR